MFLVFCLCVLRFYVCFLVSVFRTLKLVTAQPFLGFTGGGRSALTGGAHSVRLLGCAKNNSAFCILHFAFLSSFVSHLNIYIILILFPIIYLRHKSSTDLRLRNINIGIYHNLPLRIVYHLVRHIKITHIRVSLTVEE